MWSSRAIRWLVSNVASLGSNSVHFFVGYMSKKTTVFSEVGWIPFTIFVALGAY